MDARLAKAAGRVALLVGLGVWPAAAAQAEMGAGSSSVPSGTPEASVDLATTEGVRLLKAEWRYSDTKVVEVDFKAAGADGQPTGGPNRTYDFTPHAGAADFDDSGWEVIDPSLIVQATVHRALVLQLVPDLPDHPRQGRELRSHGVDGRVRDVVDDYAEVWVDGELPAALGQSGRLAGQGLERAQPRGARRATCARGSRSSSRSSASTDRFRTRRRTSSGCARRALEFYKTAVRGPVSVAPHEVNVEVDPQRPGASTPSCRRRQGLREARRGLSSSPRARSGCRDGELPALQRSQRQHHLPLVRRGRAASRSSGPRAATPAPTSPSTRQPGSNGLTLDREGRLTINEHGNRRVVRIENDGAMTVLADRYEGKRLNSPNDLVYRSDGTLYFTDPPFGLPKVFDDPPEGAAVQRRVLARERQGHAALSDDLTGPNGIAFSPDEKFLYVGNWDESEEGRHALRGAADGTLGARPGVLRHDVGARRGRPRRHQGGRSTATSTSPGPGGLWILSPDGKHLGTLVAPSTRTTWRGASRRPDAVPVRAQTGLYRIRLNVAGVRP